MTFSDAPNHPTRRRDGPAAAVCCSSFAWWVVVDRVRRLAHGEQGFDFSSRSWRSCLWHGKCPVQRHFNPIGPVPQRQASASVPPCVLRPHPLAEPVAAFTFHPFADSHTHTLRAVTERQAPTVITASAVHILISRSPGYARRWTYVPQPILQRIPSYVQRA